jgi:hypothetical protein
MGTRRRPATCKRRSTPGARPAVAIRRRPRSTPSGSWRNPRPACSVAPVRPRESSSGSVTPPAMIRAEATRSVTRSQPFRPRT